ncbi:MAG: hypothetical protein ACRCVE_13400 [Plesiomonas sp.]
MNFSNALPVSLICFSLIGCVQPAQTNALKHSEHVKQKSTSLERHSVSFTDLAHRHFVLLSVDGEMWQETDTSMETNARAMYPGIDFNEQNIISTTFCNELQGHVLQVNNKIQGIMSPLSFSTSENSVTKSTLHQKKCHDQRLNQWDVLFQQMVNTGVTLEQEGDRLFIEGAGHSMVFMLRDWVY